MKAGSRQHEWDPRSFYELQEEMSGAYSGPPTAGHRAKAALVPPHCGRSRHVLELGAGGGQMAVATAELGFAVDAIELTPALAEHARELASTVGMSLVNIIEGDFYVAALDRRYGAVTYWDGFGVGADSDQERLLRRIRDWLADDGRALIDVYTPWYWSRVAGHEMTFEDARRRYDFDAETSTMIDTWWRDGARQEGVSQRLRCYAPDELTPLLAGAGLSLETLVPGGAVGYEQAIYKEPVALGEAMSYTAVVTRQAR